MNNISFITKEVKICVIAQIIQAENGSQWLTYFEISWIMTYIQEVVLLVWTYMLIVEPFLIYIWFLVIELSILQKIAIVAKQQ